MGIKETRRYFGRRNTEHYESVDVYLKNIKTTLENFASKGSREDWLDSIVLSLAALLKDLLQDSQELANQRKKYIESIAPLKFNGYIKHRSTSKKCLQEYDKILTRIVDAYRGKEIPGLEGMDSMRAAATVFMNKHADIKKLQKDFKTSMEKMKACVSKYIESSPQFRVVIEHDNLEEKYRVGTEDEGSHELDMPDSQELAADKQDDDEYLVANDTPIEKIATTLKGDQLVIHETGTMMCTKNKAFRKAFEQAKQEELSKLGVSKASDLKQEALEEMEVCIFTKLLKSKDRKTRKRSRRQMARLEQMVQFDMDSSDDDGESNHRALRNKSSQKLKDTGESESQETDGDFEIDGDDDEEDDYDDGDKFDQETTESNFDDGDTEQSSESSETKRFKAKRALRKAKQAKESKSKANRDSGTESSDESEEEIPEHVQSPVKPSSRKKRSAQSISAKTPKKKHKRAKMTPAATTNNIVECNFDF